MSDRIGEGLQDYAVSHLRRRIRENRERIIASRQTAGACPAHDSLCDGVAVMLEAIEVILDATTRKSRAVLITASIGSGVGAAIAFFAALYKALAQ